MMMKTVANEVIDVCDCVLGPGAGRKVLQRDVDMGQTKQDRGQQ